MVGAALPNEEKETADLIESNDRFPGIVPFEERRRKKKEECVSVVPCMLFIIH